MVKGKHLSFVPSQLKLQLMHIFLSAYNADNDESEKAWQEAKTVVNSISNWNEEDIECFTELKLVEYCCWASKWPRVFRLDETLFN
jgi:hypothetical protein